ncbi:MAG TPA: protein kinase [Pyrinomonadaceae bacterium]|nr:protein kinase [Pyrinomonadaceae bacterium]
MELTSISRYRILEKLGAGGMGEVYLAEDTKLGRKVALKLLAEELTQNRDRLSRFDQEAYAASALNHPNILTIYEMGDEGGRHYIATEYIDGVTLRKRMSGPPMELSEILDVAIQVTGALEEAHAAGIVHRDIKPENVMIRKNGHVKVLDFGLAKLTEHGIGGDETDTEAVTRALVQTDAGVVLGTSQYMSPEQARGKPIDGRTDIWSLGVMLYEMASGRPPFSGETKTDVIVAIARSEPLPIARFAPTLPGEFEWIVLKALRKNVDERYQTVKEFESDLRKLKQRTEFQSELERSMGPERLTGLTGSLAAFADTEIPHAQVQLSSHSSVPRAAPATSSAQIAAQTRVSSAEYIVNEIKRHKRIAAGIGIAAVLAVIAIVYFASARRTPALTDKDTILVADFVNTTGDQVFDATLKQALSAQLRQSPFLDIFSDDRVHDALKFMDRSPNERVTREIAREICERNGIKAMLIGSIAGVGGNYVISLEAQNAKTGDSIASEQIEAEGKEQVLKSLGQAASKLREKLGESLSSIQKFDAPIDQVTTPSLEALRYYSLGLQEHSSGQYAKAIPFYRSALDVDPHFAIAYARLAACYNNTRQYELARQASSKAYEFRERASEREKLYVSWNYYGAVSGELDKAADALDVWKRTYPRDWEPHNLLAVRYTLIGPFEKAVEEAGEAARLNPKEAKAQSNMAAGFAGLNRFDEAQQVVQQAMSQKLETELMHTLLYRIAFIKGDAAGMKQQLDWAAGKSGPLALNWQAQTAEFAGQLAKANQFSDQAADVAQRNNLKEAAAQILLQQAIRSAAFRDCGKVSDLTTRALSFSRDLSHLHHAANALAACGQAAPAQSLIDEMNRNFSKDTLLINVIIPLVRAQLELSRGNGAQAVQLLESARKYEVFGDFWPQYVRAQAYLNQKNGAQAAAEFRAILDHRGWYPLSPLYSLAQLGFGRASALNAESAKARKAYQDFFDAWKEADASIPILAEARQEYEKLK